jgi:hypothetical protein
MKVYLSGPMRGHPKFNFDTFKVVASVLRTQDYDVISPADHDEEVYGPFGAHTPGYTAGDMEQFIEATGFDYHSALTWDLAQVAACDGIVMLPGWESSEGARTERFVAEALGKKVLLAEHYRPDRLHSWSARLDAIQQRMMLEPRPLPGEEIVRTDEVRHVDPVTGGMKGQKRARFDLLPWDVLWSDAELYGAGAEKYEDRNWERGYDWALSMAACLRHITAFWQYGESIDPQDGFHHLAAARFHLAALMRFERTHPSGDSRAVHTRLPAQETQR